MAEFVRNIVSWNPMNILKFKNILTLKVFLLNKFIHSQTYLSQKFWHCLDLNQTVELMVNARTLTKS